MCVGKELWVLVFVDEGAWWLVQVQILSLGCNGRSSGLSLLFGLLGGLDPLELVEDILVVEQSMGKLFLEGVVVEEVLDAVLNAGHLQQLVDVGSLGWVPLEHHGQDFSHLAGEVGWQWRILTLNDSLGKLVKGLGIEWGLEGGHLVEQDSQGPDV